MPPHLREPDMPLRQALVRSVAEECGGPRAVPFTERCFYLYRVVDGRTYPLVVDCASLEEAVERGKVRCQHKEQLVVREVGPRIDRLHIHAIKRKAQPKYVYRNFAYDRVHELYAAPVCVIDMRMLVGSAE